jgi:rhomboid family GlyGly-CTERM serine protease
MPRLPYRTLAIAAAALVAAAIPDAFRWLALDRAAVLDGEIWRIFTGHLVHASGYHLRWDVLALIGVGLLFEESLGRRFWPVVGLAAVIVSAGVLAFAPSISVYCGLSGVLNGLWIAGALFAARAERERGRAGLAWVYLACVVGAILKIAVEALTGHALFTDSGALAAEPLPLSHALGVLGGAIIVLAERVRTSPDDRTCASCA